MNSQKCRLTHTLYCSFIAQHYLKVVFGESEQCGEISLVQQVPEESRYEMMQNLVFSIIERVPWYQILRSVTKGKSLSA